MTESIVSPSATLVVAAEAAGAEPVPRLIAPANSLAVVGVTVAALASVLSSPPEAPERRWLALTVALAMAHALLGTVGLYLVERRGTRTTLRAHFALAVAVAVALVGASNGHASLACLSLISQSVLYLSRRGVIVVVALCSAAAIGIHLWLGSSGRELSLIIVGWVAAGGFVLVFSYMALSQQRARREVERLAQQLRGANERLKAYARDIEELVTVNERNRIARDIHDTVGHCLTVVHVQVDAADALLESDPPRARHALERARQLAHEGLREVRRSVAVLRGAAPAFRPIASALSRLASECEAGGIEVAVNVVGAPRPLPEPVEYTLYRAAQEALTNVRRHSGASSVKLELGFEQPRHVQLRIVDDGVGSDAPQGGLGLVGLSERAELVGGKVAIRSESGGGFTLEVEVPG